jgi:hypothetical protein
MRYIRSRNAVGSMIEQMERRGLRCLRTRDDQRLGSIPGPRSTLSDMTKDRT